MARAARSGYLRAMSRPVPRSAVVAILILISMAGPTALNIAMPVLPAIQAAFGTTRDGAALVLSTFLGAAAVAQLVLGPLADRLGRRPVLIAGFAMFTAASIWASFAHSLTELLIARIVQSLGATAGLPLARTIIRDLYDRNSSASMIGYVTMAMAIAPMLSPFLGAVAAENTGWQAVFVICGGLGLAALTAVLFFMPETRPAAIAGTSTRAVAERSLALLGRRRFLGYAGTTGCASAMYFAFQGGAPFLVIDVMGWSPAAYALWILMGACAYMAGNFTSGRLAPRLGIDRLIQIGNWIGLAGALLCLVLALMNVMHPAALFVPMAIVAGGNGLVMPNAIAGAVSVDVNAAGAASGLAGFLQSGLGAGASLTVAAIVTTSAIPVGIAMTVIGLAGLLCGFVAMAGAER